MKLREGTEKNASERVRKTYEKLPYPAVGKPTQLGRASWMAPMEWIDAMWHTDQPAPRRILVAGCGTGNEAFVFRRRFPNAEITAVDFSARSVNLARESQQELPQSKKIHFLRSDLTQHRFSRMVGGRFDFVSCHGVVGDIPRPERALDNLADCLTPDGALYLGVNGLGHFSQKWRRSLPEFGFNPNRFEDGSRLRRILRLHDALTWRRVGVIANQGPEYLASDLFGPMISNRSLAHWTALCRRSGFHLLGSYAAHQSLRPAFNNDLFDLFIPRSRAEVHQVTELITPSAFHCLVFARKPEANIPWLAPDVLKHCRVLATNLYTQRWPKRTKPWKALRCLAIKSKPTNTLVDLRVPEWVLEILRESDTERSVSEILGEALPAIATQSLRHHLYLLYLLGSINLRPPD